MTVYMTVYDYVTAKSTGTVHLASQNPAAETTLCGQRLSVATHTWGDETPNGINTTCGTCRARARFGTHRDLTVDDVEKGTT